ncbi:hypothetical protein QJS10_CPB18g00065 [Acorus calamus]|uniref:PUM-HD domain-containing protein n=1 Tax=Acorus calamus TaxID=4465 RepID=A0AAV9CLX4_ACOCL|nr:hypothetical protein QJS10_CPB18g00065 [Acorus calamus]
MAMESPVRFVGSSKSRNWASPMEAAAFDASPNDAPMQDFDSLLKGHRFHGNSSDGIPSRSGSAPPSMEGSLAAIRNFIGNQNSNAEENLVNFSNTIQNCESDEQFRADPAYLAYYYSNVNLNPRLPPPLISRENRRLVHHIGGFGDNWRMASFDDSNNKSTSFSRASLSTHKEEPEDEKSPRLTSSRLAENDAGSLSEQSTNSIVGHHKSLVDLIQEDFPRTPSPVYNQSRSSHGTADEGADTEAQLIPHGSSINLAKTSGPVGLHSGRPTSGGHAVASLNPNLSPSVPTQILSSSDMAGSAHSDIKGKSSGDEARPINDAMSDDVSSNIAGIESKLKGLNISNISNVDDHRSQQAQARQPSQQNSLQQHHMQKRGSAAQVQIMQPHMTSQGPGRLNNSVDISSYVHSKNSSVEVQPLLQSTGITPPLYAAATAYMAPGNPFLPNMQPAGIFGPQYGVGGFAMSSAFMPQFIPGFSSPTAIPMSFESPGSPNFSTQPSGISSGGSIAPAVDMQNPYKFYGQVGMAMQPSFTDPMYMQYFQHPSEDAYNGAAQYDPMASRGSVVGQVDVFDSQKGTTIAAHTGDQRPQYLRNAGVSIPSPRKGGITSPNYYGSPRSMGILMQFPTSPLASPVLPGSPVASPSVGGRRNENFRAPFSSSRNTGGYSGWQGQRGREKFEDSKACSFLEELKSNKARRLELSDISGRIVEFSADQHGSRFIQQKLETCSAEEKASVFEEVLPHASMLMTDVFGNYVIQKFFEHGNAEQRKELANQLKGNILPLSLQMYGCRVIQKALEVIELDQKTQLVHELDGHVMRCVRDQNGNHVIQKCIECVPTDKISFIISAFRGQVATLSTHPYGCRVIQRVLEHCSDESQSQCIIDEILQSACALAQDQYGNYVTQHVLERGKPHERSQIITKLAGQIVHMSQHKFASNVIEKCLEYGDTAERDLLINEIVGQTEGNDSLLIMMKDQFANYVVQKILDTCSDKQRAVLLDHIRVHLHALKKYTYGKHIVSRVEELSGEEEHPSGT